MEIFGMNSDRNYSIIPYTFIVSSRENRIIPIGINFDIFHNNKQVHIYPKNGFPKIRSFSKFKGMKWKNRNPHLIIIHFSTITSKIKKIRLIRAFLHEIKEFGKKMFCSAIRDIKPVLH